jgi:hypothetical protein
MDKRLDKKELGKVGLFNLPFLFFFAIFDKFFKHGTNRKNNKHLACPIRDR